MKKILLIFILFVLAACAGQQSISNSDTKQSGNSIEGWCVIGLTIAKDGSAKDVEILECQPNNPELAQASLIEGRKLRYNPVIVNGEAVEKAGVKYKFSFTSR